MTIEEVALSTLTETARGDMDRMNRENAAAALRGEDAPHSDRALLRQFWTIQACAQEQDDMAHWLHS